MKTRIIQTGFWKDSNVNQMSIYAQHLFIYLITSEHIGLTGIFELPDAYIKMEAKLTDLQLDNAKEELQRLGRISFYKGWIKVNNAEKHNNYAASPKNEIAFNREFSSIPREILQNLDTSIGTTIDSNHKSEIINKKPETPKGVVKGVEYLLDDSLLKELTINFPLIEQRAIKKKLLDLHDYCLSKGKTYKDYAAFARGAIRRDQDNMPKRVTATAPPELEEISDEQRSRNLNKLAEMKSKLLGGM